MTESQISPQEIEQYHSSQDRVRNWVKTHAEHTFGSPNYPPSELDDPDALSSPPSDVESSHSVPPRLMLRYPDGRETPIPHNSRSTKESHSGGSGRYSNANSHPRSPVEPHSSHHRSRLGSTPSSRHVDRRGEREKLRSHSPEEIQILPSASDEVPPVPSGSHHSRSRSLPRDAFSPTNHDPMPISPSSHHSQRSRQTAAYVPPPSMPIHGPGMSPPVIPVMPSPGPPAGFARSQPQPPPWHPYTTGVRPGPMIPPSREHLKHNPPPIIYAPSHHSSANYHPPAILSYRPSGGPDRIFYSHSVPPTQFVNGYPSVQGSRAPPDDVRAHRSRRPSSRPSSSRHRDRDRSAGSGKSKSTTGRKSGRESRDRSRSLPLDMMDQVHPPSEHPSAGRTRPPSPAGSDGSGSTYYVLPTARQKVHVLRSPDTLYTATSTTQSPTTPVSPTGSVKKPLLQRILGGFAERLSSGSSRSSLRLHRRHSTGTRSAGPVGEH